MARSETEQRVWDIKIANPQKPPEEEPSLTEMAHDFAQFISNSPVNLVLVNSVIPTKNFGTFYSVTVGTIESFEQTPEGAEITANAFSVSSDVLDLIIDNLDRESENGGGAINSMLRKNLLVILNDALNQSNWGNPFSARTDN